MVGRMRKFYLCDQTKCRCCSGKLFGQCLHTSDPKHMKYKDRPHIFKQKHGALVEIEPEQVKQAGGIILSPRPKIYL